MNISVVIPAYNAGDTIENCIQSVLDQTHAAREIIVVDDGSADNTAEVARAYSDQVTVVKQANQGSAGARQHGTDVATSEYIAYLDSDDWWPKEHLALYNQVIESEPVDFILADLQRAQHGANEAQYSQKNSTFYPWFKQYLVDHSQPGMVEDVFKLSPEQGLGLFLKGYPVYPSTMLVSKRAIRDVGPWDTRFKRCQDFDIGLRLAKKYPLHYIDRSQAILGLHEVNSNLNAYVLMQTLGDVKVLEHHMEEHSEDQRYVSNIKRSLSSKYYVLGKSYNSMGDRKQAVSAYLNALSFPGRRSRALLGLVRSLAPLG